MKQPFPGPGYGVRIRGGSDCQAFEAGKNRQTK